ncbi:MAG: trypsin-like peptidase domain-containing protein [Clostridia bacterium]|nr:trypsin-like peptidase domain-containing protein [Clostridia bacterium]
MQKFNNDDNTYNENENIGEISGFDSDYKDGFYSKTHSEIINDETDSSNAYKNEYTSVSEPYPLYSQTPPTPKFIKKEKKKYGFGILFLAIILSAVIGFGGSMLAIKFSENGVYVNPDSLPKVDNSSLNSENVSSDSSRVEKGSSVAQAVAKTCTKSVVGIRTTTSVISFFGGTSEATGEGSGVIYTANGYIITNYHVIENAVISSNASKIEVFFDNANTNGYQASVIGYNIASDLAVLKVNANGLKKANLGNSDNLTVGQYVVTIGAPGGLEFMGSVTYGIISGLNRVVSSDSNIGLIQTDAAINPGNSGGALLDKNGKLIGINSSKIVSEEFEGMGFAIPINKVVEICNNIITNKDKKEPYVGITISEKYTAEVLNAYGYPSGAVVLSVAEGSTAEKCGIQKGDIITEFNGTQISEYDVFEKVLKKCSPDMAVPIKIYRGGRYYQTKITIDSNS